MRSYSITLEHDDGIVTIITAASHILQAIIQVVEAENAPNSAVISAIDVTDEVEEELKKKKGS
jgi:hypothetical protein